LKNNGEILHKTSFVFAVLLLRLSITCKNKGNHLGLFGGVNTEIFDYSQSGKVQLNDYKQLGYQSRGDKKVRR
jgi:hypothetical protein